MKLPEIYADFNNLDGQNRIRLTTVGSRRDIERQGIELREELALTVTTDDADDEGNSDDLMADGIVRYNEKEKCWVAEIDWTRVQNRSERKKARAKPAPRLVPHPTKRPKGTKVQKPAPSRKA